MFMSQRTAIRCLGFDSGISMGVMICSGFPLASGTFISDYLLRNQPVFKVYRILRVQHS